MKNVKPRRLLTEERRREIVSVIRQHGRITVDEIVARFGISAVTARSDLGALSDAGDLVRSHGGGLRPLSATPDFPIRVRATMHREQKAAIAQAAVSLLRPNQTVILCTGSTSAEIARCLRICAPENLTVITYALNIAAQLADLPQLALLMIGGILRQVSSAFVGPQAELMMQSLHADHCFLPAVGVDLRAGLTTIDIMEAQLNRCMIANSREVSVVADSSKFGLRSLAGITDFGRVTRLITDSAAPKEYLGAIRKSGVDVVLARPAQ